MQIFLIDPRTLEIFAIIGILGMLVLLVLASPSTVIDRTHTNTHTRTHACTHMQHMYVDQL